MMMKSNYSMLEYRTADAVGASGCAAVWVPSGDVKQPFLMRDRRGPKLRQ